MAEVQGEMRMLETATYQSLKEMPLVTHRPPLGPIGPLAPNSATSWGSRLVGLGRTFSIQTTQKIF